MRVFIAGVASGVVSSMVAAQGVVIDGFLDSTGAGLYGAELSCQDSATGFGDNSLGMVDYANGSEIDTAYACHNGTTLFLFFGGNLESNFNKIEVFVDCIAGEGQNRLLGNNPDVDFNGLNRMGDDGTGAGNGLKFDADFSPDFYLTATCGGTPLSTHCNMAHLRTTGGGAGEYLGSGGAGAAGALTAGNGVMLGLDNSNILGVVGGNGGPSVGCGVATGIELALPFSVMGYTAGNIRVCAFINGSSHDYLANQVLGGVGGLPNLGDPRLVDFSQVFGKQFFEKVINAGPPPCPTDFDGDGITSGSDLALMLGSWGTPDADLDGDGDTNGADLASLLGAWGPCAP